MIRFLIGLALLPTAALTMVAAGRIVVVTALRSASSGPFIVGMALAAVGWLLGRCAAEADSPLARLEGVSRRFYVLGHEFTHALAAWSCGARVLGFKVGQSSGHVDLSHSNAFVALAPYCVPIYTLLVIAAYRFFLWLRPGGECQVAFLVLMGLTLSFHALKTVEVLWDRRQPDLAAAGGAVFSLSWIGLANGLVVLALLKALFPRAVPLGSELRGVALLTGGFWRGSWRFLRPLSTSFVAQMKRS